MDVPRSRAAGRYRPADPWDIPHGGEGCLRAAGNRKRGLIFDFDHELRMISFNVAFGYAAIMPHIFQH